MAYRENTEMRILSAIGILLVVAGHLGFDVFSVGGLFPYYSFHVFLFLFISGYFYRPDAADRIGSYLLGKGVTLLVPYYLWNVVYGVVAAVLHRQGFSIGQELSVYTLLLAPFDGGHQFLYQFPAWFVPALFLLEAANVVLRKGLRLLGMEREWLIFFASLGLGILTVWLAIGGHVWGIYRIPARLLFMMPGFQLGRIYREKLEERDNLPSGWYFLLLMGIQLVITYCCGGLAFSTVWVSSFANGPFIPYLTVLTGTAFWLRVSKILAGSAEIASVLVPIGRNTFSVMMHHILAFFAVKSVFYLLAQRTALFPDFDSAMYHSEINFLYLPGGNETIKWLYLLAGIAIPLGIGLLLQKIWELLKAGKRSRMKSNEP